MKNLKSNIVDIAQRYHPASYQHDLIHNGEQASSLLTDDYKSETLGYDRPYFNCPDLRGPDGNMFSLLQVFKDCLKSNGYTLENDEFSNSISINKTYEQVINQMALFVDMEDVIKTVVADGEEFKKVKKTPKELQNPKEFKIKTVKEFNDLIANGFDINTQNAYGRTILHYANSPELMTEILKYNEMLEQNGQKHINLFSIDNFNATYLHNRTSFESYNLIFEYMNAKNNDLMSMFVTGRDVFNHNSISTISMLCEDVFSSEEKIKKDFPKLLLTLKVINEVEPDYVHNFRETINQQDFFEKIAKTLKTTPQNISKLMKQAEVEFNYTEMNKNLPVKDKNTFKKIKI